jgi:hypothetical protein
MLVTNYSWRIHLSESGDGVATINAWATIKNTHETRYMRMIKKKCNIDRTSKSPVCNKFKFGSKNLVQNILLL